MVQQSGKPRRRERQRVAVRGVWLERGGGAGEDVGYWGALERVLPEIQIAPLAPVTGAGASEVFGPLSGNRGRGRAAVAAAGGATGAWLCGALVAMPGQDAPVP